MDIEIILRTPFGHTTYNTIHVIPASLEGRELERSLALQVTNFRHEVVHARTQEVALETAIHNLER